MKLRPGSFSWLVAHDLRQSWRSFDAALGGLTRVKIMLLIGVAAALHAAFWWGLRYIGLDDQATHDSWLSPYIAVGVLFVLPGIVAQATTATTRALYTRGDLDLIFAAPVSARAVLGARALSIAVNAVAWFALVLLPLANVQALAGHLGWLAVYPALLACGLFGTGVGVALALALFLAVGPRRARLVSQIAAAIIGASFMLAVARLCDSAGSDARFPYESHGIACRDRMARLARVSIAPRAGGGRRGRRAHPLDRPSRWSSSFSRHSLSASASRTRRSSRCGRAIAGDARTGARARSAPISARRCARRSDGSSCAIPG